MQGMGRKIWAVLGILLRHFAEGGGFEGLLEALLGDREGVGKGVRWLRRGSITIFWGFFGFFNCAVFVGFLVFS